MDLLARGAGDPFIIAAPSVLPYTTPALTANLFFRVTLALVGNIVCLVPLRLLWRNSELAAVVFIVNVELKNFETVLYSLIWRDDNMEGWWPGYGLCDVSAFFHNFSIALFATCMLAIVRNLAHQVGLMRANPLTVREKRKRNLVQALIMFPLPVLQLSLTWFLTAQRYAIGPLIGCTWVGYGAWPFLVFFVLAPVIVSIMTVGYAILCYFRFRQVSKATQTALSSNRAANYRAQRTRRRLYLMIVSILVPFFPIVIALCVVNIVHMGAPQPYDYDKIHNHASPFPWNSIVYLRSDQIDFIVLNNAYVPILTTIPIFVFFGTTKDAINDYRTVATKLGLGKIWPKLNDLYDPDRPAGGSASFGSASSQSGVTQPGSGYLNLKFRTTTSRNPLSTVSSEDTNPPHQSLSFLTQSCQEAGMANNHSLAAHSNTALHENASKPQRPLPSYDNTIHRNPFLMRTHMDFSHFKFPSFCKLSKPSKVTSKPAQHEDSHPLQPLPTARNGWSDGLQTRVWSDEETRGLCTTTNDSLDSNHRRSTPEDHARGVHVETSFTADVQRTQQR